MRRQLVNQNSDYCVDIHHSINIKIKNTTVQITPEPLLDSLGPVSRRQLQLPRHAEDGAGDPRPHVSLRRASVRRQQVL